MLIKDFECKLCISRDLISLRPCIWWSFLFTLHNLNTLIYNFRLLKPAWAKFLIRDLGSHLAQCLSVNIFALDLFVGQAGWERVPVCRHRFEMETFSIKVSNQFPLRPPKTYGPIPLLFGIFLRAHPQSAIRKNRTEFHAQRIFIGMSLALSPWQNLCWKH